MTTLLFRAERQASALRHCRAGNPLPSTNDKRVRGSPVRDLACLNSCFALQQSNLQRVNKRLTRDHNPFGHSQAGLRVTSIGGCATCTPISRAEALLLEQADEHIGNSVPLFVRAA